MTFESKYTCNGCKQELHYSKIKYQLSEPNNIDYVNVHFCSAKCLTSWVNGV